jgi:hypothetical protein
VSGCHHVGSNDWTSHWLGILTAECLIYLHGGCQLTQLWGTCASDCHGGEAVHDVSAHRASSTYVNHCGDSLDRTSADAGGGGGDGCCCWRDSLIASGKLRDCCCPQRMKLTAPVCFCFSGCRWDFFPVGGGKLSDSVCFADGLPSADFPSPTQWGLSLAENKQQNLWAPQNQSRLTWSLKQR